MTSSAYTVLYTGAGPLIISGSRHEDGHVTAPNFIHDTSALPWRDTRVEALRDAYNQMQRTLFDAHDAFHKACTDNLVLADLLLKEEIANGKSDRMD